MEQQQTCFDCLQQQIKSDFSDQLLFCYGLSDSALPIGSSAVVQIPNSNGDSLASASHFILERLTRDDHDCLATYVDGCMIQNGGNGDIHGIGDMPLSEVSDGCMIQNGVNWFNDHKSASSIIFKNSNYK